MQRETLKEALHAKNPAPIPAATWRSKALFVNSKNVLRPHSHLLNAIVKSLQMPAPLTVGSPALDKADSSLQLSLCMLQ